MKRAVATTRAPGSLPILIGVLLLACDGDSSTPAACPEADAYDVDTLKDDVFYLASPHLDGRFPGSDGDYSARAFIANRFACLGLTPLESSDWYEQPFVDEAGDETGNVIGYLPGSDSEVASDIILVSAHHDHLGDGHLGANDNASGVSGLLAIAQDFMSGPAPARTVIFAAFGAEESGFEGSEYFMSHPPDDFDPSDIVYNINMDMIGSYSEAGEVWALGALEGTEGRALVEANASLHPDLEVGLDEPSDQSDNVSFCERGIPYIFFWTEDEACYHETCDTADRVDYESLSDIAQLTGEVAMDLANSDEDLRAAVTPDSNVCEGP